MKAGQFREDLYYRLNVLHIEIPPLRARAKDIPPLARHFLAQAAARHGADAELPRMMELLLPHLKAYDWPGNVRELENIIERFAILATVHGDDAAQDAAWVLKVAPEFRRERHDMDGVDYAAAVEKYGSVAVAAKMLGISRTTLWRRLSESR